MAEAILTLIISIFARGCFVITHWLSIITAGLVVLLLMVSLKLLQLLLQVKFSEGWMQGHPGSLQTILKSCGCGRGCCSRCSSGLASIGIGEDIGDHES